MRFTVVTPSYNQLDWLRLCIASVADQGTRADTFVEHIVQDAGTRGIEQFARERGAAFYRDGREVFGARCLSGSEPCEGYRLEIRSESDAGMYDAINRGLGTASGDICAYLNCDEQYLPDTLHWVDDYFSEAPGTDILFGAAIVTKGDGSYVCDRRVTVPTPWHTMVSGNLSVFTSSTFFRREAVVGRGLLFEKEWRVCGDAVWALRLVRAGVRMRTTTRPLSAFAETGGNLSAAGNPQASREVRRLGEMAPASARIFKPLLVLSYRLRRWLGGAYCLRPHRYCIYTHAHSSERCCFDVARPTFRWQLGAS